MMSKQSKPAPMIDSNRQLLFARNSLNFDYQVRLSHLVSFLETEPQHNPGYEQSLSFLIQRVRELGLKLIIVHGQLSYSPTEKSDVEAVLSDCSLLMPSEEKSDVEAVLSSCSLLMPSEPSKLTRANSAPASLSRQSSFTNLMSTWTGRLNRPRLYFVYIKKLFDVFSPLAKSVVFYQQFISFIDELNPYLSVIAWVFYVPRLLINLFLLAKHTIAGSWMGEDERALGAWVRLVAEWSRRWQEVLNDTVWCTVGLLCCFVLSSPTALLLTVALYSFDFGMALARSMIDSAKHRKALHEADVALKTLEQKLKTSTDETEKSTLQTQLNDLAAYNAKLLAWTNYEKRLFTLGIAVTTGLSLGMVLSALPLVVTMPVLASTLLPIIGVTFILVVRSLQLIYLGQIERSKPNTNLQDTKTVKELHVARSAGNYCLFKPELTDKQGSLRKVGSLPSIKPCAD